ncbi:hypothetical protein CONLIGDRAFT_501295 [Coniochaeta ligniaria NRRL 30616]|uniref:Uncharacterized protein n=1 Tax=Coniochaeta ligniaria NRRL 30616 TaxID=1408157 RepID=A0A1J7ID43_9PEZI|nr:hypothetical protein CONLIGDRAFT_501295 [Coniochaeta ligniaria NRRL 30616]
MRFVSGHMSSSKPTGVYSHLDSGRAVKSSRDEMHRDTAASSTSRPSEGRPSLRRMRDRRRLMAAIRPLYILRVNCQEAEKNEYEGGNGFSFNDTWRERNHNNCAPYRRCSSKSRELVPESVWTHLRPSLARLAGCQIGLKWGTQLSDLVISKLDPPDKL